MSPQFPDVYGRSVRTEVTANIEEIAPSVAAKMLECNTENFRKRDRRRISRFAAVLAAGGWELNGQTISFHADGTLLDGQHRLEAIVQSGIPMTTVVVRGVVAAGRGVDRGRPRTMANWVAHEKVPNANAVASVARLVLAYKCGCWSKESIGVEQVLDDDIINFTLQNKEKLGQATRLASRVRSMVPVSVLGPVLFVGCEQLDDLETCQTAEWFVDSIRTGDSLTENDAVLHLRNRLIAERPQKQIGRLVKRGLVTLAWNKTVLGESCTASAMQIVLTGPRRRPFPSRIEQLEPEDAR